MESTRANWKQLFQVKFVMTTVFDKLWDNLELTDEDLRKFQNILMENPFEVI